MSGGEIAKPSRCRFSDNSDYFPQWGGGHYGHSHRQPRSPAAPQRRNASTSWRSPHRLTVGSPVTVRLICTDALHYPGRLTQGTPVHVYLAPDALRVLRGGAQDVAVEEPDQVS